MAAFAFESLTVCAAMITVDYDSFPATETRTHVDHVLTYDC